MKSEFKNWHNLSAQSRTKRQPLSSAFPVSVEKADDNGIKLEFQSGTDNKRVTFYLSENDKKVLLMNIDRFINGKTDVKRSDYGLS